MSCLHQESAGAGQVGMHQSSSAPLDHPLARQTTGAGTCDTAVKDSVAILEVRSAESAYSAVLHTAGAIRTTLWMSAVVIRLAPTNRAYYGCLYGCDCPSGAEQVQWHAIAERTKKTSSCKDQLIKAWQQSHTLIISQVEASAPTVASPAAPFQVSSRLSEITVKLHALSSKTSAVALAFIDGTSPW